MAKTGRPDREPGSKPDEFPPNAAAGSAETDRDGAAAEEGTSGERRAERASKLSEAARRYLELETDETDGVAVSSNGIGAAAGAKGSNPVRQGTANGKADPRGAAVESKGGNVSVKSNGSRTVPGTRAKRGLFGRGGGDGPRKATLPPEIESAVQGDLKAEAAREDLERQAAAKVPPPGANDAAAGNGAATSARADGAARREPKIRRASKKTAASVEPAGPKGRSETAAPVLSTGEPEPTAPESAPVVASATAETAAEPISMPEGGPVEDSLAGCLSFLSKIYGHTYTETQLRAGIPLNEGRLDVDGLIQSAGRIGMEAKPERIKAGKIPRLALPAILVMNDGRACVLLGYTSKSAAEIADPRIGEASAVVPLRELEADYSGHAIYVRPKFRFDTRSDVLSVEPPRSWFWGTLFQNWWIYGNAVIATVVVNILAIASPIFVMTVYDRVVPNNAVETLWVLAIAIVGVAVFDFCLRTVRGYLIDTAGKRIDIMLGTRLFDHVVRLRMDSRNASAGSLASIMREFDFLRDFLSSATVTAIGDLPFIFLFIVVIYLIGESVAYVPMIAVPVVLLISILIQIPLHKVSQASMRDSTQKNAHLFEVLHGIETIKAIRAEGWAQRIWENLVALTAMSSMKMKMLSQIGTHVTMGAQLLVTVGIVVVGVHVLKEGNMTQGAMIACVLLSSRVMAPLAQVAGVLVRYEQTKTAFNALHGLMSAPVEQGDGRKLVHKPLLEGGVELKEVSFNYPAQQTNALHGVSFKLKPGEHVAIIGRVGSGKSTILKLVQNLYEPAAGFVRVDDLDNRQIDLSDLRRQVGYVPQETVLFHGTIRENLVQGAPHATDEQVMTAVKLVGLDELIKMSPKGLDQEVGEHGSMLSGGQRQMIVLARSLVLDPPILLMDEPTSHMDNYAERQFIAKMQSWMGGRTMIMVTHRASLLALADRLIVMDKGKVVADGPKEEVLNALAAGKIGAAAA